VDTQTPLKYVKGVGPARAQVFESKGLRTAEDILGHAPFRYEDRSNVKQIQSLAPGEMATVIVRVHSARPSRAGQRMGLFEVVFIDAAGYKLTGKWFHGGYLANVFVPGMQVALFGKVEMDGFSGGVQMLHPEYEVIPEDEEQEAGLHTGRIVPIHEGGGRIVTPRIVRSIIHRVLSEVAPLEDSLPEGIRRRLKLPDYWQSVHGLHFPEAGADLRTLNNFRSPAHWRMIFEEFFWLECGLALKRIEARKQRGIEFELNDGVRGKIKAMLPFKPTGAQKRVLGEIAKDMASPFPMHRLLQGDVGSGKTLVAAEAAIIAIENGYQTALLAPTEILAQQHYFTIRRLFEKIGYLTLLLTGSASAREKQHGKKLISAGLVPIVIGTHALLEEDVEFGKLGLVIIDEQHRFGVMQRLSLREKGAMPDVLVMTATPIPRTLALTAYGDLDTSVIDELPPGRKPVKTSNVMEHAAGSVWEFVRAQVAQGRQAYVVCPVIEESETQAVKAAEKTFEYLRTVVFPQLTIGLLHGRLRPDEKESVMSRFQAGEIQILVSTTVIEVGVDVANATVMVIEQAERFGLAQLHQLRGRVGRGAHESYCILITGNLGDQARERIRTMTESNDGFHIAETDLKLRGPGEFFGTKQSGMPVLRIANIIRDREILEVARAEAWAFVENPPSEAELKSALRYLDEHWQRRYGLVQVA
jgi:ATP-dependent DNA helicase RecG